MAEVRREAYAQFLTLSIITGISAAQSLCYDLVVSFHLNKFPLQLLEFLLYLTSLFIVFHSKYDYIIFNI